MCSNDVTVFAKTIIHLFLAEKKNPFHSGFFFLFQRARFSPVGECGAAGGGTGSGSPPWGSAAQPEGGYPHHRKRSPAPVGRNQDRPHRGRGVAKKEESNTWHTIRQKFCVMLSEA